jgi:hypothetical protein
VAFINPELHTRKWEKQISKMQAYVEHERWSRYADIQSVLRRIYWRTHNELSETWEVGRLKSWSCSLPPITNICKTIANRHFLYLHVEQILHKSILFNCIIWRLKGLHTHIKRTRGLHL